MVNPRVPMDTRKRTEPDSEEDNDWRCEEVHLQGDGEVVPEGLPNRTRCHEGPPHVASRDLFDPSDILDIKRLIETKLLDNSRDIFGLLGGCHIRGGPAFWTEGHEDAEKKNRDPEQNETQKEEPSNDVGKHRVRCPSEKYGLKKNRRGTARSPAVLRLACHKITTTPRILLHPRQGCSRCGPRSITLSISASGSHCRL